METLVFYCTHGLMTLSVIGIFSARWYQNNALKRVVIRYRKRLISPGPILKAIYRFF
jgi:hypothetical protein